MNKLSAALILALFAVSALVMPFFINVAFHRSLDETSFSDNKKEGEEKSLLACFSLFFVLFLSA